jgi:filamentous hemagglutinin family protein
MDFFSTYLGKVWNKKICTIGQTSLLKAGFFLAFLIIPSLVRAQVIGDKTLPVPTDTTFSDNVFTINGGTHRGNALFHSFERFDLPNDTLKAFFNNTSTINNIFARVTGGSVSRIYGQIAAEGTANLFFINPSGIIFGPNATLNIGGSFIGSTADSIIFANGGEFSVSNPQVPPLLSVNIPIALQFRPNPGAILVEGTGHNLRQIDVTFPKIDRSNSVEGLRVNPGKTLALIGGNISLTGSTLTAEGGHIELGAVNSGVIELSETAAGWNFGFEGVSSFRDIELTQLAALDASGFKGGSIHLQGDRIKVTDGSLVLIQTEGSQSGADLTVDAFKSFEVSGADLERAIRTSVINQSVGEGNGGDLVVSTKQLVVRDGGFVTTRALNNGSGGNIVLNASESVDLIGSSNFDTDFSTVIDAVTQGAGNSGKLTVSTTRLTIQDGGQLGTAGINLTSLDEGLTLTPVPNPGSLGDVTVNATQLVQVLSAGALFSVTYGAGNAGKLVINTQKVEVRDGGSIESATFAGGNAGSIIINASESLDIRGLLADATAPSQIISSANLLDAETRAFYFLPDVPSGRSGSLIINSPSLVINDSAQITVRNDGTGPAGNLLINANSIVLDNKAGITASTESGEGGNITLNAGRLLQLGKNSLISATAGGTGNGGNLDINAQFLLSFPKANGDISANALSGKGGAISIFAKGIFGFAISDRLTTENDITAFSQLQPALNGIITLNTPDIDPSRGLLDLPETVIDPYTLIAQNPCKKGTQSQFARTGRGGLPPNPTGDLNANITQVSLIEPVMSQPTATSTDEVTASHSESILPAQGWVYNNQGKIVLTAYNPTVTESHRAPERSPSCPAL